MAYKLVQKIRTTITIDPDLLSAAKIASLIAHRGSVSKYLSELIARDVKVLTGSSPAPSRAKADISW